MLLDRHETNDMKDRQEDSDTRIVRVDRLTTLKLQKVPKNIPREQTDTGENQRDDHKASPQ